MAGAIETFLTRAARALAWAGGLILVAIALMTVASITGRALVPFGLSPVRGDFELVEAGTAIAVFSFLPWCHLKRGHVAVDILTGRMPGRVQAAMGFLGDVLMALAAGVILWRLWLGFGEKFPYGSDALRAVLGMGDKPWFPETTYELELPYWIAYGACLPGAVLFLAVSLYACARSFRWTLRGWEEGV